jgi:hypothetical protein
MSTSEKRLNSKGHSLAAYDISFRSARPANALAAFLVESMFSFRTHWKWFAHDFKVIVFFGRLLASLFNFQCNLQPIATRPL